MKACSVTVHFGFVLDGGFVVVDTQTHASACASPTSANGVSARVDEAPTAGRMIAQARGERDGTSPKIWEDCYRMLAAMLRATGQEII